MFYLVRSPWWLRKFYPMLTWRMPVREKVLYLTFDDGPHPVATPYVLDTLKQYNAKATFFVIGKNVEEYPNIYARLLAEGHRTGNHTHNHLNGWRVKDKVYFDNIRQAARYIDSDLFRPPYGRIRKFQAAMLQAAPNNFRVIMWDVLSGDFDRSLTAAECAFNVKKFARPGSIIVFHDSEKAFERVQGALPEVLAYFTGLGYRFDTIRV